MLSSKLELKNFNYVFIDELDYGLIKRTIKDNLVSLCWGEENNDVFTISDVIKEFMVRFSRKNINQKYGYIGELIYYIYVLNNSNVMRPISLFFNQEDKSFKKGFDFLGFDGDNVWYSEVKSGNSEGKDINLYNIERLNKAYSDICKKLISKDRNDTYWETAKSNLCKIVTSKNDRTVIADIINSDKKNSNIENKVIVSVIFEDSDVQLNKDNIEKIYNRISSKDPCITIISIRKKTIDRVIKILEEVQYESS